jgi:undecaprenyl-diphosphatase
MRHREWDRSAGRRWLVVAAVAGGLFLVLTWAVLALDRVPSVDLTVTRWIADHRTPAVTTLCRGLAVLGSWPSLLVLSLAVGGWYLWRSRDWRPGAELVVALLGSIVLYRVVKAIIDRPRPPAWLRIGNEVPSGAAFPSGHATQTVAVLGILALILASGRSRRTDVAIAWVAGLILFAVGVSRVYLGLHWMTDVIGGWLLGLFWMATMVVGAGRGAFRPRGAPVRTGWYRPVRGP